MSKSIDLIGKKFSRLTVLKRMDNNKHRQSTWLCRCDCGKETIIIGRNLKNGNTQSCGCFHKERASIANITHGHRKNCITSNIYTVWESMIKRCTNPKNKSYHNYGGRGIKVCKRWLKFENFLEDMGEVPEGYQIDRIDNNGNYCKSNCRWTTKKEQARNKRNNRLLICGGKTQCLAAWVEEYNINYDTLWYRIYKLGWPIEKALTTPVKKYRQNLKTKV